MLEVKQWKNWMTPLSPTRFETFRKRWQVEIGRCRWINVRAPEVYISSDVGILRPGYKERINLRTNSRCRHTCLKKIRRNCYATYVLKRIFPRWASESSGLTYFTAVSFFMRMKRVAGCVKETVYVRAQLWLNAHETHTNAQHEYWDNPFPFSACNGRASTDAWQREPRYSSRCHPDAIVFSTIGTASPWDRKCNRYSTLEFLPPMCSAGTNTRKLHSCSCGTRTLEKLSQYRAWIAAVAAEGLSWRSVGTAALFLRHQRPV